jgi:formylglycine-generating enzyme required for sulfatase activity
MDNSRRLRLVVVSPSDVSAERALVPNVVNDLNVGVCAERGLHIVAYGWERQGYAALHPKGYQQGVIDPNLEIEDADIVIAIFWSRLGTPDPRLAGKTGSQYELDQALEHLRTTASRSVTPLVAVYRNAHPPPGHWRDGEASRQRIALDEYLRQLESYAPPNESPASEPGNHRAPPTGLVADYEGPRAFAHELRTHLENWVRENFPIAASALSPDRLAPSARSATSNGEAGSAELLRAYHRVLEADHAQLPGLFREHVADLDTVYIELALDLDVEAGLNERHRVGRTLRQLMEEAPRSVERANRWVVLGHPGAGKSTLARHLAWELAREHRREPSESPRTRPPIVVYSSLPALAADRRHPFDGAEEALSTSVGQASAAGLSRCLFERAQQRGSVWLLLDGLDELTAEQRKPVDADLQKWAGELPQVTIAVFSRIVGYRRPVPAYAAQARLRPLTPAQQQRLLERWLGPELARRAWSRLAHSVALREACQVPLSLSLLAFLTREGGEPPSSRRALYHRSIDVLLERGHDDGGHGVRSPPNARRLLGELSLALQGTPGEAWTVETLRERLLELPSEVQPLLRPWELAGIDFLGDVGNRSGVLAPHDGERAPWRFFHRQFRELVAAEALHRRGEDAVLERARALTPAQVPRWAEVLGFASELSKSPLDLLGQLAKTNEELALRVLPEVEGIDPTEALAVLMPNRKWNGDFLMRLFARWRGQGTFDTEKVAGWLWRQVDAKRSVHELAALHYALAEIEGGVERERFFRQCGRWPEAGPPEPRLLDIPAGEFAMGSPESEPGRNDNERQHGVELSAFRLSPTAVTNAEYALFDPRHSAESFQGRVRSDEQGEHPVVRVSWWEAYLYCAWADGHLPTEAQWEYACRAGSTTAYSFGEHLETDRANTFEKRLYRTLKVRSLPANDWGVLEMHGNVWEWCSDWHAEYDADDRVVDPKGPRSGSERVLRGGSWIFAGAFARCASRFHLAPDFRDVFVGFRLARGPRTST